MRIEVYALCDAATDSHGKLNILGTFDQIYAIKVPIVHPSCAVAMRLRFGKMEEGVHRISLQLVNPDGLPVLKPVEGDVNPRMGADIESVAVNLVLNFQNIKFEGFADYQINLSIDGVAMASLPLRVREMPRAHVV